jgi:hypothetical protein
MANPKSALASPLGYLPTHQHFFEAFKRTRKDLTPLLVTMYLGFFINSGEAYLYPSMPPTGIS